MNNKWYINCKHNWTHNWSKHLRREHTSCTKTMLLNHWLHMYYYWNVQLNGTVRIMFLLVSIQVLLSFWPRYHVDSVKRTVDWQSIVSMNIMWIKRFDSDNGCLKWQNVSVFCGTFSLVHWMNGISLIGL